MICSMHKVWWKSLGKNHESNNKASFRFFKCGKLEKIVGERGAYIPYTYSIYIYPRIETKRCSLGQGLRYYVENNEVKKAQVGIINIRVSRLL